MLTLWSDQWNLEIIIVTKHWVVKNVKCQVQIYGHKCQEDGQTMVKRMLPKADKNFVILHCKETL